MSSNKPNEASEAAAILGKKGGQSGTGEKKRRDDTHYKVTLPEKRRAAKTKRILLGEE